MKKRLVKLVKLSESSNRDPLDFQIDRSVDYEKELNSHDLVDLVRLAIFSSSCFQ